MFKRFVIHEHHATRLHFDLRLEIGGVLKSWAVPKGPSLDPKDKRLAVAVPDHALSYIDYEGTIAEGSYGAGPVRIWDDGHFESKGNDVKSLEKGRLDITFFGLKLRGEFHLVRLKDGDKNWLLIKSSDAYADPEWKLETVLEPRKKRSSKTKR